VKLSNGGGEKFMMWGYGMRGDYIGVLGTFFWIVILIDLILLGLWLWKQLQKK